MIRRLTLQIGVPALFVCMALNAYLAIAHLRQTQKMEALTLESSTMQASISGVLRDLTDMETGQRGYLLTGDESYLEPYNRAKNSIGSDFAALRNGLAHRAEDQRALATRLETLANSKQAEMERTIDLRQKGYRHRAFTLVSSDEGKGYMDEARRLASALASTESSYAKSAEIEKSTERRKILDRTIGASAGLFFLAICLLALFRYHERRLSEESTLRKQQLAVRDEQLRKLTSALSGRAQLNITALNTNSRLLLENYGGFLPRQGHEYAEQLKEAATEMELLRQDLVGNHDSEREAVAA